jgi:hypothetical protein
MYTIGARGVADCEGWGMGVVLDAIRSVLLAHHNQRKKRCKAIVTLKWRFVLPISPTFGDALGKALDGLGNTAARLPLARILFSAGIAYA